MLGLYLDATIDFFTEQKTRRKTKMNVSFESSKTLAVEGAVLVLLSLIPYVGWVLGIVGVVLLAKAMKEFSNYYQDQSLYQKAWTGIKFYIVAIVAAAVAIVGIVLGAASATSMFATNATFVFTAGFAAGLITLLAGLVVAFVFYVLAANHLQRLLQQPRKEIRRTQLRNRRHTTLDRRNTNHHRSRLNPDPSRMDLCNHRVLQHESSPLPTIHPTNQRLLHPTTNQPRTRSHPNPNTNRIRGNNHDRTNTRPNQNRIRLERLHTQTLGSICGPNSSRSHSVRSSQSTSSPGSPPTPSPVA